MSTPDAETTTEASTTDQRSTDAGRRVGSVAVGFVAGPLVPSTRVEDQKIGSVAQETAQGAGTQAPGTPQYSAR